MRKPVTVRLIVRFCCVINGVSWLLYLNVTINRW